MDLNQPVIYRGYTLNDPSIVTSAGSGVGDGIVGCVIDSVDMSDVDVVQFTEKRSLEDGLDAGKPFLGGRRIRMAGTLYAATRGLFFDAWNDLCAALSPTLALADEPADKGYQPLYFSQATNRAEEFPEGTIDQRVLAMPKSGPVGVFQRDQQGGSDADGMAMPWQAVFVLRDPTKQGITPVDTDLNVTTIVTGATAAASTDLVSKTAHGLVAGDRVYFATLTGGTGLSLNVAYFVLASGLTANAFKVSLSAGGAAINVTVDYSAVAYVKVASQAGDLINRGTYFAPLNMLIEVDQKAGSIVVSPIGGSSFTLTVPASTGARIIRVKGEDKIVTVEEESVESLAMDYITWQNDTTWPLIPTGTSPYSLTVTGLNITTGHFWFWERYA